ncbi:MAG: helix-turn-helix domain-containing protein [FCB group bacterium]|nr:helix-turn-helix domain-containing protein [FCB group bacterium]
MLNENDVLTVDEAKRLLKISRKTLYNLIQTGELPAVKVGRGWRIMVGTIEKYLKGEIQQNRK